jgi:host cell factor
MFTKVIGNHSHSKMGHKAVFIKTINRILIFGGGNNGFCTDILLYDLESNQYIHDTKEKLKRSNCFNGLAAHQMVILNDMSKVLIFGGITEYGSSNQLYLLEDKDWFELKMIQQVGDIPCARFGHSLTVIGDHRIVLFGGVESLTKPNFFNDLHILHIEDGFFRWEKIEISGNVPPARESHSAVLHYDQLIIFGGSRGTIERLNDVWMLDLNTFTWNMLECKGCSPTGRSQHSADVIDDKMYVFGGMVDSTSMESIRVTNELYYLDLYTFEWDIYTHLLKPEPRANHATVVCDGRLYFFSGRGERKLKAVCYSDIWYHEVKAPRRIKSITIDQPGINFISIQWTRVNNAVFYAIELQEVTEEKPMLYELIEPPMHDDKIIVKKTEAPKVEVKRPKIIIQEHKILKPEEYPMSFVQLQTMNTSGRKIYKILPSGALITEEIPQDDMETDEDVEYICIEQLDGSNDVSQRFSDTESETETKVQKINHWFLVGFCKDLKYRISSYHLYSINRANLTSHNIPRLSALGLIELKPDTSYYVRVSCVNSCGISQPSKTIIAKTQRPYGL